MGAKLINLTGRVLTVLLEHEQAARHPVHFVRTAHNAKTGEVAHERHFMSVPQAITILRGQAVTLPAWAAFCPDVRRLEGIKAIRVEREPDEVADAPSPEPAVREAPAPVEDATAKRGRGKA